jgi:hypothetical protein
MSTLEIGLMIGAAAAGIAAIVIGIVAVGRFARRSKRRAPLPEAKKPDSNEVKARHPEPVVSGKLKPQAH